MSVTYLMLTDALEDNALFRDRYHSLSPDRQKKIDSFTVPRDKNLSLAAGLLFQAGLADLGLRERELTIARGSGLHDLYLGLHRKTQGRDDQPRQSHQPDSQ